jgi:hypothetical protein
MTVGRVAVACVVAVAAFALGRVVGRRGGEVAPSRVVAPPPAVAPSAAVVAPRPTLPSPPSAPSRRDPDAPPSPVEVALAKPVTEPAAVAEGRHRALLAELAATAPALPAAARDFILAESDRIALRKRALRDAFARGEVSEADYVAALKDDVRASLVAYEGALSDADYLALTHRPKGSGIDPFSVESLAPGATKPEAVTPGPGKLAAPP